MRRLLAALLSASTLIASGAAAAQEPAPTLEVGPVDAAAHPQVTTMLTAPAALGGVSLEPGSVTVTESGQERPAEIVRLPGDQLEVVLVVDTSGSMRGAAFAAAKEAASAFIAQLPVDARVALVAFGSSPQVASPLAPDHLAAIGAVQGLEARGETALYDAVRLGTEQFGAAGSRRSLIVLSDGGDTASKIPIEEAAASVSAAGAHLDVIELVTTESARQALDRLAAAGGGSVVPATDPSALSGIYDALAASLANEYQLTWRSTAHGPTPVTIEVQQGEVLARHDVVVEYPAAPVTTAAQAVRPPPPVVAATVPGDSPVWLLVVGAGCVAAALFLVALQVTRPALRRRRLTRLGAPSAMRPATTTLGEMSVRAAAAAEHALDRGDRRVDLDRRLEQAGVSLRAGEFVVLVLSAIVVGAITGFLIAGPFFAAVLGALCFGGSKVALGVLRDRRRRKFSEQLSDTLQLLAGSLRAGYGLLQAVDALSKEAPEPTSSEFRRLVVETRLGRDFSQCLTAMAERLDTEDFEWVVQAIDINREVGGDLAEVLDTVGATIRERNQVYRQVKTLTAEGRMSAYVLISLPLLMAAYQALVNWDSFRLLTFGPGLVMSVVGLVMLTIGGLWFRVLCKLDY